MAKKHSYNEIQAIIAKFSDVTSTSSELTVDGRRSYAFAAGALESLLASVLMDLPAHKQESTLAVLQNLTNKYSAKA